jgi:hypothetical protein
LATRAGTRSAATRGVLASRILRFFQQNGDTIVEANTTDLTAGAELRIVLDPLVSLQAGNFVL